MFVEACKSKYLLWLLISVLVAGNVLLVFGVKIKQQFFSPHTLSTLNAVYANLECTEASHQTSISENNKPSQELFVSCGGFF